ncbi:hypothetical protein IW261DRAFT_1671119 [Armillaria novae-zelandiae]|uniref:Uncharacterized protein n=1 Tax=Armillaria novae-zelandiae TaxID=153914 RepID=A0AA39T8A0_9AGAR|nr:hypothetical protein IW261DRAFT_1671119 [Armillaria novae-zelandiae]
MTHSLCQKAVEDSLIFHDTNIYTSGTVLDTYFEFTTPLRFTTSELKGLPNLDRLIGIKDSSESLHAKVIVSSIYGYTNFFADLLSFATLVDTSAFTLIRNSLRTMPSSSHTEADQQRRETISARFTVPPTTLATDDEAQTGSQIGTSGSTAETVRQSRLVQLDEKLLELEPPGNPFLPDECDDETERDFEFIWATAGPLFRLAEADRDDIGHRRMSDAYDILKRYRRLNLYKFDILSLAQYKLFQKILISMEQLLARVHLIRTENNDVGFRLNQELYSEFMSMLRFIGSKWDSKTSAADMGTIQ